jgi:MFS family permease
MKKIFFISQLLLLVSFFCLFLFPFQNYYGKYFISAKTTISTKFLSSSLSPSSSNSFSFPLFCIFICYFLFSFNFSVFTSVPFALIASLVPAEDSGYIFFFDLIFYFFFFDYVGLYSGAMNISCVLGQGLSLIISFLISYICTKNNNCGFNYNYSNLSGDGDNKFFIRHSMQWQFLIFSIFCIFPLIFCVFLKSSNPKLDVSEKEGLIEKNEKSSNTSVELTEIKLFGDDI